MNENQKKCGLVAFCGLPNAGKSTLLNALVGARLAPVTSRPETTRRQVKGVLTEGDTQFVFVDTPGMSELSPGLRNYMAKQVQEAVANVDVIVWVTDATKSKTPAFEAEVQRLQALLKLVPAKTPVVLALNKSDALADRAALLPLLEQWGKIQAFQEMLPISAQKKKGLSELKKVLADRLTEQAFFFEPDTLTDASERDIACELIRESAIRLLSEELPYRVAVTVERFDEARREDSKKPLVEIEAVLHVEKDSQKAIVIGKGAQKIKAIGEHARRTLEVILGVQVMLRLFVRVEEKWSKDKNALRKLGYR